MKFSISNILDITQGRLLQEGPQKSVSRISINSRTCRPKDCFIAIKGDRFDGHDFLRKAKKAGANFLIISKRTKQLPKTITVILVKDTVKAFGLLAKAHRDNFEIPIIAITGSAGKTSTKEFVAAVLKKRFKVLKSEKSENNHVGVPQTLLRLNKSHEIAVIECGTNQFGDIPWLAKLVNPSVVIFTNIGASHLAGLKTPQGVFREKLHLAKFLSRRKGVAFFNRDDSFLKQIPKRLKGVKTISYGLKANAKIKASAISLSGAHGYKFVVDGKKFYLKNPSLAQVYNALAAIGVARFFKINMKDIADVLKGMRFKKDRLSVKRTNKIKLIDDTYNANPVSLKNALQTLAGLPCRGKKVLVCGDMLELGRQAQFYHKEMGKNAALLKLDTIFTVGSVSRFIGLEAQRYFQTIEVQHFKDKQKLSRKLLKIISSGDIVLVKGSHSLEMHKVIDFITNISIKNSK